jgi:hypothetical protein
MNNKEYRGMGKDPFKASDVISHVKIPLVFHVLQTVSLHHRLMIK